MRGSRAVSRIRVFALFASAALAFAAVCAAWGPGEVPERYRRLYALESLALDGWERYLAKRPVPAFPRPVWAGELLAANANRGEALLQPQALEATRLFLDRFQALGLTGVTVSVNYPLLDPGFPRASEYAAFFRQVALEVRKRRMTLDVESGVLFANTAFSSVRFDYGELSWERFVAGRRAHTATILREMAPDYLNIGAEPDTEARLTGKRQLNDPDGRAAMLRAILKDLDRGRTKVAAGIGTWGDIRFVRAYLAETDLDAIALHLYPLGRRTLRTAYEAARLAREAGKPVLLDECWLYKAGPGEGQSIAANEAIFQRDLWSFWAPLDRRFLECVDRFARQEGIVYVSPFWSHHYFAYLDYDPALDEAGYAAVNGAFLERARVAVKEGRLSPTGEGLKRMLSGE